MPISPLLPSSVIDLDCTLYVSNSHAKSNLAPII